MSLDHVLILIVSETTPTVFAIICILLGVLIGAFFDFASAWRDAYGRNARRSRELAYLRSFPGSGMNHGR